MWQTIFGIIAALGLAALLARRFLEDLERKRAVPDKLFGEALHVLDDARIVPEPSAGSYRLVGRYRGHEAQAQTVIDTLNVRKLPSLWLLVTIAEPLPVRATFDLMMRPAGPTTFSNFDHLPVTIERPADFPENAVIRTDDAEHMLPIHVVAPHLGPFRGRTAKELLITPKGLRMVLQIGEADRVRYGVFRQADFGDAAVDPALLRDALDRLLALKQDVVDWYQRQQ